MPGDRDAVEGGGRVYWISSSAQSTQAYERYIVTILAAGAVEVDDRGRINVIWVAGRTVGFQFNWGQLMSPPQDAVKVVLSSDTGLVHAFPAHSTTSTGAQCADCGRAVVI